MSLSINSLPSRRFQSLPSRGPASQQAPSAAEAAPHKRSTGSLLAAAAGLTLAAGALAGCGGPTPPAAEAGAYSMETPEVVVLSDSMQRIDLSRETETQCTGTGEDETCTTEDVSYHPIGIHFGHGLVEDLNGNLFSAPQLIAQDGPGIAAKNPDKVFLDGPLGTEGNLNRVDAHTVETRNSLFGYHTITLSPGQAVVSGPTLFGGKYEQMRVRVEDGVARISEGRWDQEIAQSQGDHILVQNQLGTELANIKHSADGHTYSVTRPSLFKDYSLNVTYQGGNVSFTDNAWGKDPVITSGQNAQGQTTFETRTGGWRNNTTTVTSDGWNDNSPGLFGGSTVEYHINGGRMLPGH